jgi:hypothetical protein
MAMAAGRGEISGSGEMWAAKMKIMASIINGEIMASKERNNGENSEIK